MQLGAELHELRRLPHGHPTTLGVPLPQHRGHELLDEAHLSIGREPMSSKVPRLEPAPHQF